MTMGVFYGVIEQLTALFHAEQAPGKTFVEDGYFYGYALIKRVTGEETTAIVRKPVGTQCQKYEVLYYTPEIKL